MAGLPEFARAYANLASSSLGAEVVAVSDDFFAPAARMLSDRPPVFVPDKYDAHGKWMDGWESRRSRDHSKNDWCVLRLATGALPRGVLIDTAHFTGNHPQMAGVDFCPDPVGALPPDKLSNWMPLLPAKKLKPDRAHYFAHRKFSLQPEAVRYVRLNIYPNGGVARFRLFGEAQGEPPAAEDGLKEVSSLLCGGRVVDWNDSHFGEPWVILKPDRAKSMQDGWETRRRRGDGFDWMLLRLPRPARIRRVEVDTGHFKGNFPAFCSLEVGGKSGKSGKWIPLLPKVPLTANSRHFFDKEVLRLPPADFARLCIYPDGGVSRLRLFGEFA